VLCCVQQLCVYISDMYLYARTWAVLKLDCWFRLSLDLGLVFVYFTILLLLFAFVVLRLVSSVSSVLSQEIGWEARL